MPLICLIDKKSIDSKESLTKSKIKLIGKEKKSFLTCPMSNGDLAREIKMASTHDIHTFSYTHSHSRNRRAEGKEKDTWSECQIQPSV